MLFLVVLQTLEGISAESCRKWSTFVQRLKNTFEVELSQLLSHPLPADCGFYRMSIEKQVSKASATRRHGDTTVSDSL